MTSTAEPIDPIDFTSVMQQGCPYQTYTRMHAEGRKVYKDPGNGYYVVTDYAEVRRIAADTRRFSNKTGILVQRDTPLQKQIDAMYAKDAWPQMHTLVTNDPPSHRMFRSLVDRLFTAQRVAQMESYIQTLVEEAIDRVIDTGEIDVARDLAGMFPAIIAGDFLGLPRADQEKLKDWTNASNALTEPSFDEENEMAMNRKVIELLNYMVERANISAVAEDGSFMHHARTFEVDGRRLTDQELAWFVQPLYVGGHDSITLLIPTGMLRIIEQPGLEQRLRDDPALIANFIEELMRFDAPVQALWRRALEEVEIDGVVIPEGGIIQLQWGAANRDPDKFDNPDDFIVDRPNARQHLAFGTGAHLCIGNQLARAEMRIAFETMLRRMHNFRLSDEEGAVQMRRHYMQWGAETLKLQFDKIA
nr:cytochrome P450 [Sphingomonas sp. CDS-1]